METIVIIETDLKDGDKRCIGVASNTENALRMIREYYGEEATIHNFEDIRDSGLEFLVEVVVPGKLGGKYDVLGRDFIINDI